MKTTITVLICLCAFFCAATETNRVAVLTTNTLYAAPWFREVDGQLYNTQLSNRFRQINGSVLEVLTNAALIDWKNWHSTPYPGLSRRAGCIDYGDAHRPDKF